VIVVDRVWHFSGAASVPPQLRETPFELYDADIVGLTLVYDVMLYREDGKIVLALDAPRGRFRQR
jgi:hypothetical protein